MQQNKSEIARLREQWALDEQAMVWQRLGLAVQASHDAITARMERGGERILRLIDEGKHEEALALANTEWWEDGQERRDMQARKGKRDKTGPTHTQSRQRGASRR